MRSVKTLDISATHWFKQTITICKKVFIPPQSFWNFFANLLLGTNHELKNRYMHVDFVDENTSQSINPKISKYQFDTLDCTLEELAVLELVAKNPTIKQQELAEATGKSIATIKRIMKSLQDKNYIRRESGKRYGKWEVLV